MTDDILNLLSVSCYEDLSPMEDSKGLVMKSSSIIYIYIYKLLLY